MRIVLQKVQQLTLACLLDEMDCGWHLNCLQKGTLAIIQGQIKLKDPTEEISVAQSLKQLLLRAREFLGEIKQLKFDCSNILGIRVFYVGSLVSEDILSKGNLLYSWPNQALSVLLF